MCWLSKVRWVQQHESQIVEVDAPFSQRPSAFHRPLVLGTKMGIVSLRYLGAAVCIPTTLALSVGKN